MTDPDITEPGQPPQAVQPPQAAQPPQAPSQHTPSQAEWDPPEPTVGPAPGVQWAGFGERLVGYIVDGLILSVVITIISLLFTPAILSGIDLSDPENPIFTSGFFASVFLITFTAAVIAVLYFPLFWSRGGQTPGMRLVGIRVVRDEDGGPVTLGAAILRLFGFWISGLVFWLGYIWVLIDKRRRGWFDLIANTVVIKDPKGRYARR